MIENPTGKTTLVIWVSSTGIKAMAERFIANGLDFEIKYAHPAWYFTTHAARFDLVQMWTLDFYHTLKIIELPEFVQQ